jgi:hypothetical protein
MLRRPKHSKIEVVAPKEEDIFYPKQGLCVSAVDLSFEFIAFPLTGYLI